MRTLRVLRIGTLLHGIGVPGTIAFLALSSSLTAVQARKDEASEKFGSVSDVLSQ